MRSFGFGCNGPDVVDDVGGLVRRHSAVLQKGLDVGEYFLLLRRRKMRTVENGMDILRQFLMLRARFFISSQGGHQVSRQFGNGRRRRFRARGRRRQMTHQRRLLRGGRIGVGPVTEGVKIGAEGGDVLQGGF